MAISIKTSIKISDKNFKRYKQNLILLNSKKIGVGLFVDISPFIIMKALVNEFGATREMVTKKGKKILIEIPSRPFAQITFYKNYRKVAKDFAVLVKNASNPSVNFMRELSLIASTQKKAMQKTVKDFKTPPNSFYTIKLKGFDNPLIFTGQMKGAIEGRILTK